MNLSIIKEKVNKLPKNPGVYIFKDKTGVILYIGKATSLRDRVRSYFNFADTKLRMNTNLRTANRPIEIMIGEVESIDFIETDSVLEALILEANLIKKHQPKYNIKERDDKSFSYAVITQEEFPRVLILRQTELQDPHLVSPLKRGRKKEGVFGPYTSKKNLEVALNIIRKIFPYHSLKQKTEKGCLDFQIGRCPGPYAGAISKIDYAKNIRGIQMILEGKKKGLVKKLEKEMKAQAKNHEFEKAGELRNKIFALNHINDIALISNRDENFQFPISNFQTNSKFKIQNSEFRVEAYDISNISGQYAVGSMVVFDNNEPNKNEYRKFKIKTVEGANDVGMMAEVLFRRFRNEWRKPNLIFLDGGKGHLNMAEKVLQELNLEIPLVAVAKGPTRKISNFEFLISNQIPMSKLSNEIKNFLQDKLLVGRIIEEAHRFAIAYHKKIRKKAFL